MKKIFIKLLIIILNEKNYKFFYEFFYAPFISKYYQIYFLIRYFFLNKEYKISKFSKQKPNLIVISQIQRSGGTLMTQLFDGHKNILSYPSELIITKPKWDWSKKKNYYDYKNQISMFARKKKYFKWGSADEKKLISIKKFNFNYDLIKQKYIYDKIQQDNNFQSQIYSYFSSFFLSFQNLKKKNFNQKNYISFFTPRLNMNKYSMKLFFSSFEKSYAITLFRSPLSWLSSAIRHSRNYRNPNHALNLWNLSTISSYNLKKKYPNRVILINFEIFVKNTEREMKKICKKLNIKFSKSLLHPTFNEKKIYSDSSFNTSLGKIDKKVLNREKNLKHDIMKQIDKKLLIKANKIYMKTLNLSLGKKN